MMNRIYRLVWNATQQAWVVAGEFCRTHKKTKMLFFERYTTRLLRALSGIFSPVVRTSVTTIALVMASTHALGLLPARLTLMGRTVQDGSTLPMEWDATKSPLRQDHRQY